MGTVSLKRRGGRLGAAFRSVIAQEAGERISLNGEDGLSSLIQCGLGSKSDAWRAILASEVVAASIGHARHEQFWCFFAEDWLWRTNFVAQPSLAAECAAMVKSIGLSLQEQGVPESEVSDLLRRLSAEPKLRRRKKVALSKRAFRELVTTFGSDSGDFHHQGNELGCFGPTIDEAVAVVACRSIQSLDIGFPKDASSEEIEALRILLHGFRDSLKEIRCETCLRELPPEPDPEKCWSRVMPELERIETLEGFESLGLQFDDSVVNWLCNNTKLEYVRAEPSRLCSVTDRAVQNLTSRESIRMVDIDSSNITMSRWKSLASENRSVNWFVAGRKVRN